MKMAKLKRMLTHPRRNESGQGALAMVLLLLMLGAIILTPLLVFMQTGVKAGQVYESKLQAFYAADSGIEDACCELLLPEENRTHFQGDDPSLIDPWNLSEQVNVMDVTLEWLNVTPLPIGGELHTVRSTAKLSDENKSIIVAQIEATSSFAAFWENAITSKDDLTIKPGSYVEGDVQYGGELDNKGVVNGSEIHEEPEDWPTAEELSEFYMADVANETHWTGDQTIDINGNATDPTVIGPLYCDGDLQLKGSGYAELRGTIYVTGKFSVEGTPAITLILAQRDLNDDGDYEDGNETPTVYAEYSGTQKNKFAISIEPGCNINGTGNFIGVGDVKFQPSMSSSEGDFVFVMSVSGTLDFQPSGDFYGAVVGNAEVELSPGNSLINPGYSGGPHFPPGDPVTRIITYSIEY